MDERIVQVEAIIREDIEYTDKFSVRDAAREIISLFDKWSRGAPGEAAVESAARALISRMEEIYRHPAFESVWTVNQLHTGPYTGPKWEDEFNALKAALTPNSGEGR